MSKKVVLKERGTDEVMYPVTLIDYVLDKDGNKVILPPNTLSTQITGISSKVNEIEEVTSAALCDLNNRILQMSSDLASLAADINALKKAASID